MGGRELRIRRRNVKELINIAFIFLHFAPNLLFSLNFALFNLEFCGCHQRL